MIKDKLVMVIFIVLLIASCSTKKPNPHSPVEYLQLNQNHSLKHKACLEHVKKVLRPAISESENPDLDDENYYFVRDEQKALSFIENFDVDKFTLHENQLEYESIIKACVINRDPGHVTCDTLLPAFKFLRGLIHGMNQYGWSNPTKQKGTSITISYIKYVAKSHSSLMDVLLANDLLMRLSNRKYIDPKIYAKTITLRKSGESAFKELKKKVKKLGRKDLTCEDARGFYDDERIKVRELSEDLLVLVQELP